MMDMLTNQSLGSILLVDDNPTNLEVLSKSLAYEGFQIAVAIDGESALEQIKYHRPALILLDVMMPGIDGFETCRRLKANPETADIPVIFMTGISDTEEKVSGLSLGAVDYITKPFQHEELIARVRVHLKLQNLTGTLKSQNYQLKEEIERREATEAKLIVANRNLEALSAELEIRVNERTSELSQAIKDLQQAQLQLVQQEKLSALGQLIAGIAHEINNPVGFIYGNITHASEYLEDLLKVFSLYKHHYPHPRQEIQEELENLELDFVAKDLPAVLRSIRTGAERIRSLVLGLKVFSRLDEAEVKDANIHECIDSTLMILNSRIKQYANGHEIRVEKDYSELPSITCHPGQLNQVFMNILSNAIDALEDKDKERQETDWWPEIKIKTQITNNDYVAIRIMDNGTGIPEHIKHKIFDPFFTTKPVGKGTGLGMSISYQIITEKHQGSLECFSTPGKGTDFLIAIPKTTARKPQPC
jgi:signal transduction histidine kinase